MSHHLTRILTPPVINRVGHVFQRVTKSGRTDTIINESLLADYAREFIQNKPAEGKKKFIIFVAMSFCTEEESSLVDYYKSMERAAGRCSTSNIILRRIDEMQGDYEITQALMKEIDNSDVVLADFTLSPQNVYYEVGYARGKGKTLIRIARKDTRLEFDVRNSRTLTYRNATELEELLVKAFNALGEGNRS